MRDEHVPPTMPPRSPWHAYCVMRRDLQAARDPLRRLARRSRSRSSSCTTPTRPRTLTPSSCCRARRPGCRWLQARAAGLRAAADRLARIEAPVRRRSATARPRSTLVCFSATSTRGEARIVSAHRAPAEPTHPRRRHVAVPRLPRTADLRAVLRRRPEHGRLGADVVADPKYMATESAKLAYQSVSGARLRSQEQDDERVHGDPRPRRPTRDRARR